MSATSASTRNPWTETAYLVKIQRFHGTNQTGQALGLGTNPLPPPDQAFSRCEFNHTPLEHVEALEHIPGLNMD